MDAKRGKIFTKIGKEIVVAVKQGGPSADSNPRLRDVIAKAKANNMPNDTIERSIKKASGELNAVDYETIAVYVSGTILTSASKNSSPSPSKVSLTVPKSS